MTQQQLDRRKIRALLRHLDPKMHIGLEITCLAIGLWCLTHAILGATGVINYSPIGAVFLAAALTIIWIGDLIRKIRAERARLREIRWHQ